MHNYDKFVREIIDVRRWLFTTIYSYTTIGDQFSDRIRTGENIKEQVDLAFNETGCNEYSFIRRLTTDNAKTCKELALIRCISALEVFLIDMVREVYIANTSPFLSNTKIVYHIGEILSCDDISDLKNKYIEIQCRNLHSSGFEEIQKYYKKTFGIDFTNFSHQVDITGYGITFIQQYHQIRHLIIHRLGQTDDQYRRKYNYNDSFIKLSETDLSIFFDVLLSFSSFIERKMSQFILTPPPENRIEIKVEIITDVALKYFEPTFKIKIKKNILIPLSSIIKSKEFNSSNVLIIQLHGAIVHIRKYYKILLKRASAGEIKILSYDTLSLAPTSNKVKQFPWDDVERVIALLPEKPWQKNIHKVIATQLGWSNNKVNQIINNIVTERPIQISLGRRRLELQVDDSFTFSLSVTPQEMSNDIIWQSSNSDIATVTDGTIVAIAPGCADIYARINGNLNRSVCAITVIE